MPAEKGAREPATALLLGENSVADKGGSRISSSFSLAALRCIFNIWLIVTMYLNILSKVKFIFQLLASEHQAVTAVAGSARPPSLPTAQHISRAINLG